MALAITNIEQWKGNIFNVGLSAANLSKLELASRIKHFLPDLLIIEEDLATDPDQRNYVVSNEKVESFGFYPMYSLDSGVCEVLQACSLVPKYALGNV